MYMGGWCYLMCRNLDYEKTFLGKEMCWPLGELIWHNSPSDSALSVSHNHFHRTGLDLYRDLVLIKKRKFEQCWYRIANNFGRPWSFKTFFNQKFICLARRPHFLFLGMKFNFSFHLGVHADPAYWPEYLLAVLLLARKPLICPLIGSSLPDSQSVSVAPVSVELCLAHDFRDIYTNWHFVTLLYKSIWWKC